MWPCKRALHDSTLLPILDRESQLVKWDSSAILTAGELASSVGGDEKLAQCLLHRKRVLSGVPQSLVMREGNRCLR